MVGVELLWAVGLAQAGLTLLLVLALLLRRLWLQNLGFEAQRQGLAHAELMRGWLVDGGDLDRVRALLRGLTVGSAIDHLSSVARMAHPDQLRELTDGLRDEAWVQRGLRGLDSRFWWRRLESARLLAHVADAGDVAAVRRLLADRHVLLRMTGALALKRVADPAAVEGLLDRLPDQPRLTAAFETTVLRDLDAVAAPRLVARLQPTQPPARLRVWLGVVEASSNPAYLLPTVALSRHASPEVRLAATRALRQFFDLAAAHALLPRLADDDWRIRAQAARALGILRFSPAVPRLAAAVADGNWWVRFRACLALVQVGGPAAEAALAALRAADDRFARDMATMVHRMPAGSVLELAEA